MVTRRHFLAMCGGGALVGGGVLASAGCGRTREPTLARIKRDGVARVGISDEQPFSYLDASGQITGESPAVASAVLTGMGVPRLEAVQRPFSELIPSLLAGTLDIVTAGMEITPGRCAQVAFSNPDFLAPTGFLVPRGNPRQLYSFEAVARAGLRIAVLDGTVEQGFARTAGVPEDRILACRSQGSLFQAVFDGSAPVAALTDISLRSVLRLHPDSPLQVNGGIPPPGRFTQPAAGFAFRPADVDLLQAFNTGLAALHGSGQWLKIASPFGVTSANLPPSDVTTASLCHPV
jgi:polar amino acid transport system substrate-binding protein